MKRPMSADKDTGSGASKARYGSALAEEVLASEQTVLRLITRNTPLPALLEEVCRRAEALLGHEARCSILLLDAEGRHMLVGAAPSLPKDYSNAIEGLEIGPDVGSCGTAMFERRMVIVEDIATDPLWAPFKALALPHGLRACWSVPFEDESGKVLGAFGVYYRTPRGPTAQEEAILRDISSSVGLAVHQDAIARRLAQSEEYHRLVVNHLNEGIVVQTPAGEVIACNPSAHRMLHASGNLVGRQIGSVILRACREDGTVIEEADQPTRWVLASGKPLVGLTLSLDLVDGDTVWITENVVPIIKPGESEPSAVLISFNDIGPVRAAQQQLRYLATRDSLTGLYNRAYLADRMREMLDPAGAPDALDALARAARPEHAAVLFIDLDGFKKVNDTAGHDAGDALLCSVAQRLAGCVRAEDTLARVGGDEFVMLIADHGGPDALARLARRVVDTVAVPFAVAGNEYYLGASIGISLFPEHGRDATTLMRNADAAMYHAKQHGRNQFQFFTEQLNRHLQRRFTIERALRRAMAAGDLSLVYQPIVDGRCSRTAGAEALLRLNDPELGPVTPAEFIPVAEDTGLIVPMGRWVIEQACAQAAEWRRTLAPDLVVAVNLSPRQLNDDLVEHVAQTLARTGLAPAALELEITEGLLMRDSETVLPMLKALTDMGVHISVDDFGTGYSSLSYLKRFPLHNLKIDRSFVNGLPDHRDSVAITSAVVAMAHSLGMTVTAEGVETREQALFLRSIGCDKQQGYFFSRPMPACTYAERLMAPPVGLGVLNEMSA